MRVHRFDLLRHAHLPWAQGAPASVTQVFAFLTLCLCAVGVAAILINVVIGLGFDFLPGGGR